MRVAIANCNETLNTIQQELCLKLDGRGVRNRDELNEYIAIIGTEPGFIFFLHWSWIIPENIYSNFDCIVFHMTDLPYGRGGSPLQNLIVRGHQHTKLSAIKVEKGLDTGPIYLKKDLSLEGSAKEIFLRVGAIIENMILEIVEKNIEPQVQKGEVIYFQRRKPFESEISKEISSIEQLYDFIRMLDAPGYPNAFFETNNLKFEFTDAILNKELNEIKANVRISKK